MSLLLLVVQQQCPQTFQFHDTDGSDDLQPVQEEMHRRIWDHIMDFRLTSGEKILASLSPAPTFFRKLLLSMAAKVCNSMCILISSHPVLGNRL
jgi:hypothetical protein